MDGVQPHAVAADGSLSAGGSWPPCSLRVAVVTDEDGKTAASFTDGEGRTVLERRSAGGGNFADTHYVYDSRGLLRYVLPPEASARFEKGDGASADIISSLCYAYGYDALNRCVKKTLPGCAPVQMRYNRGGRLCLWQDGNLRAKGRWAVTLRDRYGRTAVKALARVDSPQKADCLSLRVRFTGGDGTLCGYALGDGLDGFLSDIEPLEVYYYDSYDFIEALNLDGLQYQDMPGYDARYVCEAAPGYSAKGLCTGKLTRVLGSDTMLASAVYYDCRGNVVQSHEQNALGGYEHCYYHLNFMGKPLEIRKFHRTFDATNEDITRYTYDCMERLLTISLSHDGAAPVTLASNSYDALGRLTACAVNGGGSVTRYAYNVRGWTQGVTNPHFSQQIHYQDAPQGGVPCWGGGISGVTWRQRESLKAESATESVYRFSYDGLDRLTKACFTSSGEQWNGDLISRGDRDFSCTYSYDLNGNILTLQRHGVTDYVTSLPTHVRAYGIIDDLKMEYDGNQLIQVTDAAEDLTYAGAMDFRDGTEEAVEYTYDAGGNMTSDLNRGIASITYNQLNLPQRILFKDGHESRYTYAADGRKLRTEYRLNNFQIIDKSDASGNDWAEQGLADGGMVVGPGVSDSVKIDNPNYTTLTVRDYCGNYIYKNGKLERILTDNGYMQDGELYFYIKDYQGNVRVVLDQRNRPVELSAYYPYGMLMAATPSDNRQPHKYGTKELDRENGLDCYDSQARWYAPQTGRTYTLDPMAEKYPHLSPYLWCAANPVKNIDNDGKKIALAYNSTESFKSDYAVAYRYLKQHDASFVLDELDARPATFFICEYDGDSYFNPNNNTIYWNSHRALLTKTAYTLTPAELLSHESDHALEFDKNKDAATKRNNTSDKDYGNKEDRRVIEGSPDFVIASPKILYQRV